MEKVSELVASQLLQINAIKLQPATPFTWASGWMSPIYCDNRKTLAFPHVRNYIKINFARLITELYGEYDVIAGVATGAIAQGALVADLLGKPFVYVRSAPKGHGLTNLIEGDLPRGSKVVVIEDLISTGGSSLKAVEAIREYGCEVLGMVAIFTYNFKTAEDNFTAAGVKLNTLSCYNDLIELASSNGSISKEEIQALNQWRVDPANWKGL